MGSSGSESGLGGTGQEWVGWSWPGGLGRGWTRPWIQGNGPKGEEEAHILGWCLLSGDLSGHPKSQVQDPRPWDLRFMERTKQQYLKSENTFMIKQ